MAPPTRLALLGQFGLIPLVIVAVGVAVFILFGVVADEDPDPRAYLREIRTGHSNRRWQAAFELGERIFSLEQAVRYVVRGGIAGAFVECGVWRGGSMMAMALTLLDEGLSDRELFLCDTYEGMPEPGADDIGVTGKSAHPTWKKRLVHGESQWCRAALDEVRANLVSTGYDQARMHFIKGRVQDTLPCDALGPIALLRLDTDWYESTKWELEQLYPQLATGGVLIIDDYGRWQGCRKAVDEYFASRGVTMLLARIDSYARMGIKT